MANSRMMESLVLEQSLPDGNCSFNAFVLGWCRADILNRVDSLTPPKHYPANTLPEFIKQSAKALGVGLSWVSVKRKLLLLRSTDKVYLQKQMSPVFRHLSVNLARHNRVFRQRTEMHLKSAFLDFVMPIKKSVDDDIFSRHKFIRDKFAELNPLSRQSWLSLPLWSKPVAKPSEQVLSEAMTKLIDWWFKAGYELFLQAMQEDKVWAGDIELDLFGDFFDLNVDVRRKDFIHHIHINYGGVERRLFSEDQIIELRYRGIVNAEADDCDRLCFLPLSESEVVERLSALPDSDSIREFVFEAGVALKLKPVPIEWAASLQQMIQRNMLKRQGDEYYFNCDANVALNLLEEFPGKERMLRLWRSNYINKPTIILKNDDATHWDNLRDRLQDQAGELSFKSQLAVFLAANALYVAMLQQFASRRFGLFASRLYPLSVRMGLPNIVSDSRPEM